jgi:hypothetical protein
MLQNLASIQNLSKARMEYYIEGIVTMPQSYERGILN